MLKNLKNQSKSNIIKLTQDSQYKKFHTDDKSKIPHKPKVTNYTKKNTN